MTEWRCIPGFPTHEISEEGMIRRRDARGSYPAGYVSTPKLDRYGYYHIGLRKDGSRQWFTVHRLVALAFIGCAPSDKHQVAHNDGVRTNNHYSNLRWATPKQNMADRVKHGNQYSAPGVENPRARLTEHQVRLIRREVAKGMRQRELAFRFGVSQGNISCINLRKSWRHI